MDAMHVNDVNTVFAEIHGKRNRAPLQPQSKTTTVIQTAPKQTAVFTLLWAPVQSIARHYIQTGNAAIFYITMVIAQSIIFQAEHNGYGRQQALFVALGVAYVSSLHIHALDLWMASLSGPPRTSEAHGNTPRVTAEAHSELVRNATTRRRVELLRRCFSSVFTISLWSIMELVHLWLRGMAKANEGNKMLITNVVMIVLYHCVRLMHEPVPAEVSRRTTST